MKAKDSPFFRFKMNKLMTNEQPNESVLRDADVTRNRGGSIGGGGGSAAVEKAGIAEPRRPIRSIGGATPLAGLATLHCGAPVLPGPSLTLAKHVGEVGMLPHKRGLVTTPGTVVDCSATVKNAVAGILSCSRSGSERGSGGASKAQFGLPDAKSFPAKLMHILSRDDILDVASWLPHGRSFVIRNPDRFTREVLPIYFKQAKFSSFTRKLYRWGFRHITRGTDADSYYHELFQRDSPKRCLNMYCTYSDGVVLNKKARQQAAAAMVVGGAAGTTQSEPEGLSYNLGGSGTSSDFHKQDEQPTAVHQLRQQQHQLPSLTNHPSDLTSSYMGATCTQRLNESTSVPSSEYPQNPNVYPDSAAINYTELAHKAPQMREPSPHAAIFPSPYMGMAYLDQDAIMKQPPPAPQSDSSNFGIGFDLSSGTIPEYGKQTMAEIPKKLQPTPQGMPPPNSNIAEGDAADSSGGILKEQSYDHSPPPMAEAAYQNSSAFPALAQSPGPLRPPTDENDVMGHYMYEQNLMAAVRCGMLSPQVYITYVKARMEKSEGKKVERRNSMNANAS